MNCPKCGSKARTNGAVVREGRVKQRSICKNKHTFYSSEEERRNMLRKKEERMHRHIASEYAWVNCIY